MTLIDRLKSAHSFHGDPLHREAWEALEMTWRPMDTAPKDGTEVLLLYKLTRYSSSIQEGWFDEEEDEWQLSWGEVDKILSSSKPIKWMPRPTDPEEIEIMK